LIISNTFPSSEGKEREKEREREREREREQRRGRESREVSSACSNET
jgi:hypothetical protein